MAITSLSLSLSIFFHHDIVQLHLLCVVQSLLIYLGFMSLREGGLDHSLQVSCCLQIIHAFLILTSAPSVGDLECPSPLFSRAEFLCRSVPDTRGTDMPLSYSSISTDCTFDFREGEQITMVDFSIEECNIIPWFCLWNAFMEGESHGDLFLQLRLWRPVFQIPKYA